MWQWYLFYFKVTVSGPADSHFIDKTSTIATLYTWPPDDRLNMSPKHVEAW
jgi:hypothetical protein